MARLPRLYAPSVVQHVVQRPVSGRRPFLDGADYALFVDLLEEGVRSHGIALHAYVLLPTEVRLLATPPQAGSLARLMQGIGRRYVPHLNRKAGLTGPLWHGRYRSTLIDADEYLLSSMRHLEGLPVAQALVDEPAAWRWSSYGHHVGREQQAFISDHAHYWALSDTPFERQAIYRNDGATALPEDVSARIDHAVERGWLLGGPAFAASLEDALNRRAHPSRRGRRRKGSDNVVSLISGAQEEDAY